MVTLAGRIVGIRAAIQHEERTAARPARLFRLEQLLWSAEARHERCRQARDYCRPLSLSETVARRAVRADGDLASIIDLSGQARAARCRRVVGMMRIRS
jgi:hypothetical protein